MSPPARTNPGLILFVLNKATEEYFMTEMILNWVQIAHDANTHFRVAVTHAKSCNVKCQIQS